MNTIIEISAYIAIAILLGLVFGWLITRLLLKEKYQKDLTDVSEELLAYKKDFKLLKAQSKELNFKKDNAAKTDVVDESNGTLGECQKALQLKDELISSLTTKLSLSEEKQMEIEKKYEEEIDAFMFERIDITQKYKALLEKFNAMEDKREDSKEKTSFFSRLFSSSSNPPVS